MDAKNSALQELISVKMALYRKMDHNIYHKSAISAANNIFTFSLNKINTHPTMMSKIKAP